ncbi:MAG: class I SAM-dependent methyltransferase [Candidatus Omnitrophota bacterium]
MRKKIAGFLSTILILNLVSQNGAWGGLITRDSLRAISFAERESSEQVKTEATFIRECSDPQQDYRAARAEWELKHTNTGGVSCAYDPDGVTCSLGNHRIKWVFTVVNIKNGHEMRIGQDDVVTHGFIESETAKEELLRQKRETLSDQRERLRLLIRYQGYLTPALTADESTHFSALTARKTDIGDKDIPMIETLSHKLSQIRIRGQSVEQIEQKRITLLESSKSCKRLAELAKRLEAETLTDVEMCDMSRCLAPLTFLRSSRLEWGGNRTDPEQFAKYLKITVDWLSVLWLADRYAPAIIDGSIDKVLDLGAGTSALYLALQESGVTQPPVTDIELRQDMRDVAVNQNGFCASMADLQQDLPDEGAFGLVSASFSIHHLKKEDFVATLLEANRVLKPKAEFAITLPATVDVTPDFLTNINEAGFELVENAQTGFSPDPAAMSLFRENYEPEVIGEIEQMIKKRFRVIILRKMHDIEPERREDVKKQLLMVPGFGLRVPPLMKGHTGQPLAQPRPEHIAAVIALHEDWGGLDRDLIRPQELKQTKVRPSAEFYQQLEIFERRPSALLLLSERNARFILDLLSRKANKQFLATEVSRFSALYTSLKNTNGLAAAKVLENETSHATLQASMSSTELIGAIELIANRNRLLAQLFPEREERSYISGRLDANAEPGSIRQNLRSRYALLLKIIPPRITPMAHVNAACETIHRFIAQNAQDIADPAIRQAIVMRLIDMENSTLPEIHKLGMNVRSVLEKLPWSELRFMMLLTLKANGITAYPAAFKTTTGAQGQIYVGSIAGKKLTMAAGSLQPDVNVLVVPEQDPVDGWIFKVYPEGKDPSKDEPDSYSRFDYEGKKLESYPGPARQRILDRLEDKDVRLVTFEAKTNSIGQIHIGNLAVKPVDLASGSEQSNVNVLVVPEQDPVDGWIFKVYPEGKDPSKDEPDSYSRFDYEGKKLESYPGPARQRILDRLEDKDVRLVTFEAKTNANGTIYIGRLAGRDVYLASGSERVNVNATIVPEQDPVDGWIFKVYPEGKDPSRDAPDSYSRFDYEGKKLESYPGPGKQRILDRLDGKDVKLNEFKSTTLSGGLIYIGVVLSKKLALASGSKQPGINVVVVPARIGENDWILKVYHESKNPQTGEPDSISEFDYANKKLKAVKFLARRAELYLLSQI